SNQKNTGEDEYIIIPNPIYDVVFRYLMEDEESAIIVLSTLLNVTIKELEMEPLTHAEKKKPSAATEIRDPKTKDDIRLFHLDFTATIELEDGTEELVMIELQKASEPDDIFRFKRYISRNFQRERDAEVIDPETRTVISIKQPIRLIPIFILNFRIENEVNDILVKTSREILGVFSEKTLKKQNEFIGNLTYDIWVVQLPNLSKFQPEDFEADTYKSNLYSLLKLFDQKSKVKTNEHRLRLIQRFFPDFLDRVIRRLQAADIHNSDLEEQMFAEDEYLRALQLRDNKISFYESKVKAQGKALSEKNKELKEKNQELSKKDKELDDKNEALNAQRQVILELAKSLKSYGISDAEIQQKTGLSLEEIEQF
ncbi:MAG: hypothetical protein AAGI49_18540, partial [Bacteroidota bacterium]